MEVKMTKKEVLTMIVVMVVALLILMYMHGWFRNGLLGDFKSRETVEWNYLNKSAHVLLDIDSYDGGVILSILDRTSRNWNPDQHTYVYKYDGKAIYLDGMIFGEENKPFNLRLTDLDAQSNLTETMGLKTDSKYVLHVTFKDVKGEVFEDYLQSDDVTAEEFMEALKQSQATETQSIKSVGAES